MRTPKLRSRAMLALLFFMFANCTETHKPKEGHRQETETLDYDVCVYAATPSGILAALALKRAGKSVIIVEPSKWVGGILGAGIKPIQDCPNFDAVGGQTRELMKKLGVGDSDRPVTADYLRELSASTTTPLTVRQDFKKICERQNIQITYDHRVSRCAARHGHIDTAVFDFAPFDQTGCPPANPSRPEALRVSARIYIDASYEGELMARAGASYVTGRESKHDYGEAKAGKNPPTNLTPISPFTEAQNPKSGVLPLIQAKEAHNKIGQGDHFTQAYNYRFYVTDIDSLKAPFGKSKAYDPARFEAVGRYVQYLCDRYSGKQLLNKLKMIFPGWGNRADFNYQRKSLFSIAPLQISHLYANGNYALKAKVWKAHQDYLRDLHYFLSTDNRVPGEYSDYVKSLGLDRSQHPDTKGWPHQLYIRVSRRLVGQYTITDANVYNRRKAPNPICLAQYGIDAYPSRRIWFRRNDTTFVAIEGNMFLGGAKGPTNKPYPIPYEAILPQRHECTNLLVPVCFSATHQGYASARMEPVFMMCGESAGIAANIALDTELPVQDIDRKLLRQNLREAGQLLEWPRP